MTKAARVTAEDYMTRLAPWAAGSAADDWHCPGRPDLICYGSGYNSWGVQTNQKGLAALAIMAVDESLDEKHAGQSRDEILHRALGMLRFSLASHLTGDYHCADGQQWGHTWISVLGVARMMHGVAALGEHLTEADQAALRRMLVSEAEWLLRHHPVRGRIDARWGGNVPESNIWNGALLHRVALMYPDEPLADEFREKGTRFLVNGISVPADGLDKQTIYDGRPVCDWYVGPNFTENLGLHHHAYLNVGYMVICVSNIAMLHFSCRESGWTPPAALYHHAAELTRLINTMTYADGRLLRIGGDTRVRYCYCQDYAIPMWVLAEDIWGDAEAAGFEAGWLEQVACEQSANGDGTFLSTRCATMRDASPLYFTRLESDRAVTLSMGAYWRRMMAAAPRRDAQSAAPSAATPAEVLWTDDFHGACYHRSPRRMASFVWQAAQRPQGLCLPAAQSNLAEWRENLCGEVRGTGKLHPQQAVGWTQASFDGGFVTCGSWTISSLQMAAEGQKDDLLLAVGRAAFAALPDDATVLVMQYMHCGGRRVFLRSVKSGHLLVPNDIFNDFARGYACEEGEVDAAEPGRITETGSPWLCVDGCLALTAGYGVDQWRIYRPKERQIGLARGHADPVGGMLYADEVCGLCRLDTHPAEPGEVLFDVGFAVTVGLDTGAAQAYQQGGGCAGVELGGGPLLRGLRAQGQDGREYLLVTNFGEQDAAGRAAEVTTGSWRDLANGATFEAAGGLTVTAPARTARLLVRG